MRRFTSLLMVLLVLGSMAPAGARGSRPVEMGTDASGDAPPALDITSLHVGTDKDALDIRIGVAGMLPVLAGYPELPGIEWTFDVKDRTFVAEAAIVRGQPEFFLFEKKGDQFQQTGSPTGTYKWDDGFIKILVPFSDIGAKSGTRISGTGPKGTQDVDSHVHLGLTDHVPDTMATVRDYVIP